MKPTELNLTKGALLAALALVVMRPAAAQEYTFITLAGLPGTPGSDDGAGSAARFCMPRHVAVDSAGNVYVADFANETIRKVTPGGKVTTLAGLAGIKGSDDGAGSAARFHFPEGVAVDAAGTVYVTDAGNDTIRKVTPDGVVTTLAGRAGMPGWNDGVGSGASFYGPWGVAVGMPGHLYVADTYNWTVREMTEVGTNWVVTTVTGGFDGYSVDVAVDREGNLYVADEQWGIIQKVTNVGLGWEVTTLAGGFDYPEGVAVDAAGNVYVADAGNNTIRKVTPLGVVTTLAGLEGIPGTADGTGAAARFNFPFGVAVDGAGNLYVGDELNHAIRMGTTNTCPDTPTIDAAAGPTWQARQLDTSPQTAVGWRWSLLNRPASSAAALSATDIRNPTFTPDIPRLYVFQLDATNAAGAICIRALPFTAAPAPPVIATQPWTQTGETGSHVWNFVEVANTPPGTVYQWFFGGDTVPDATNSSLSLANLQPSQAGAYTVVVTNQFGAATSAPSLLSVIPPVAKKIVPALNCAGELGNLLHLDYTDGVQAGAQWMPLSHFTLTSKPQIDFDLSEPLPPQRYYRAWQTNGPQPALDIRLATEIALTGLIGASVRIDYINAIGPTNAWITLDTVTLTNSPQLYFDLTAFRQPARLYRLVSSP